MMWTLRGLTSLEPIIQEACPFLHLSSICGHLHISDRALIVYLPALASCYLPYVNSTAGSKRVRCVFQTRLSEDSAHSRSLYCARRSRGCAV